jgi:Family of unknown function (DUF6931)
MARIRFETARDLIEAYPSARDELMIEPADVPSLEFLKQLSEQPPIDKAIGFCAYLLPRREAVWWGCQCVRSLAAPIANEEAALQAAENWVREPEDERRLAALAIGRQSNYRLPATWMALAAGWAGGAMPPGSLVGFEGAVLPQAGDAWLPIPPDQTAKGVRTGILIAAAKVPPQERSERLSRCIAEGARLASDQTKAA